MNKSVPMATRQFVALRADYRCEYCRKPELVANFAFHVEHIIGRQHQGSDRLDNLGIDPQSITPHFRSLLNPPLTPGPSTSP